MAALPLGEQTHILSTYLRPILIEPRSVDSVVPRPSRGLCSYDAVGAAGLL